METYENEALGVKFSIKRPSVMDQIIYLDNMGKGTLLAWYAGRRLIADWHFEAMPDKNTDLATVDDPAVTNTVLWAAEQVAGYMLDLGVLEKNG